MSPTSLTEQQKRAVHMREASVALSAGAGCGKTHVLTERFISHVDPTSGDAARLGQLIAITFTDAAAREMRSRIRKACYDRLQTPGLTEPQQDAWLRLLRELDTARVSTIHAFCTSLLRSHATEAGLDPTFDVLEQGAADVLRLGVMDDVLRRRLDLKDDDTLDLAATFTLARLKEQVAALIGRRHEPAFKHWLAETDDELAAKTEKLVATWKASHDGEAFQNCVREIAASASIDEIVAMLHGIEPERQQFQEAREALLELLPTLKSGDIRHDQLQLILQHARLKPAKGAAICTAKDWGSKELYDRYGKLCTELRDCINSTKAVPWNETAAREAAKLGLKLLRLTGAVVAEYQRRKNDIGKLDFDDLLSLAYQLLTDPKNDSLRDKLSADLQLLLVDEFQDTDPLQIELVKIVCGEGFDTGRLFFVGDFKQSIYRFRGAQPPEFLRLRGEVPEAGQLPLTLNFRSQPGILDFVNALFRDEFAEYDRLRPHRESAAGDQPAVEFLWTITPDKNTHSKGAREAARRKEADRVARRLVELIDPESDATPILDKDSDKPRRVKPGDVAILFRALSDVRVYEEALRDHGLDYYLVGGHAFYAQQEIYDVLNLLRAVASTADEISLAGVLRSPFFSLADETLFWLADSAESLNAGLFADSLPVQLSAEEETKPSAAAETLAYLRSIKDRVPIATLLNQALDRTGYDAVLLGEFLGERKLANLQKLVEQARAADGGGLDLNGFIVELAEFITRPPQEPLASTCQETADVIRLMTIHRAKGLEFPVVVVPDLDRAPNFKGPVAALDRELGPLVQPPIDDDADKSETGMSLFTAREKTQELDERKRLLYVACTRAADYLILSSSLQSFDDPASDWMKLIAERFNLADGELLASLPEDYGKPGVFVRGAAEPEGAANRRSRGPDLLKVLDEAHRLAEKGQGISPREVEPIPVNSAARRQFSFSRLTGKIIRCDMPALIASTPVDERAGSSTIPFLDPRSLGTLVHDVLARIDLNEPASIAAWAEHLAPNHVIQNADEASRTAAELVRRFAASKRGREMRGAESAEREVEFILSWPLDQPNNDGTYLRGFIDCLYQDADGRLILVDYKTDKIPDAAIPRAAERYAMQLYVYAIAAERALDQSPAELVLHFLRPGAEHVFAWNDTVRRQAIEMVNQAIAATIAPDELQIANCNS